MFAVLSRTIACADRFSDSLQHYWNAHGVYRTIARYDAEVELIAALTHLSYEGIILNEISEPLDLILQIRELCPRCKIAVVTGSDASAKNNDLALACQYLNVELLLTRVDFEQSLAQVSLRLCVL